MRTELGTMQQQMAATAAMLDSYAQLLKESEQKFTEYSQQQCRALATRLRTLSDHLGRKGK